MGTPRPVPDIRSIVVPAVRSFQDIVNLATASWAAPLRVRMRCAVVVNARFRSGQCVSHFYLAL